MLNQVGGLPLSIIASFLPFRENHSRFILVSTHFHDSVSNNTMSGYYWKCKYLEYHLRKIKWLKRCSEIYKAYTELFDDCLKHLQHDLKQFHKKDKLNQAHYSCKSLEQKVCFNWMNILYRFFKSSWISSAFFILITRVPIDKSEHNNWMYTSGLNWFMAQIFLRLDKNIPHVIKQMIKHKPYHILKGLTGSCCFREDILKVIVDKYQPSFCHETAIRLIHSCAVRYSGHAKIPLPTLKYVMNCIVTYFRPFHNVPLKRVVIDVLPLFAPYNMCHTLSQLLLQTLEKIKDNPMQTEEYDTLLISLVNNTDDERAKLYITKALRNKVSPEVASQFTIQ